MRIPIILMLLTALLLPADLRGFADDLGAGMTTATTTVSSLLHRNDTVRIAEVATPQAAIVKASLKR